MELKLGARGCAFFWGRVAGSRSNTIWPGPRPTKFHLDPSTRLATIHQRHRQTGQTTVRWHRATRFGATVFVKRFALCYRAVVCAVCLSVLSVCL